MRRAAVILSLLLLLALPVVWLWSYPNWRMALSQGQIILLIVEPDANGMGYLAELEKEGYTNARICDDVLRGVRPYPNVDRFGLTYYANKKEHGPQYMTTVSGTRQSIALSGFRYVFPVQLLSVSVWWLAPLLLIAPGYALASTLIRKRRFRTGLCARCGYDLRESRDRCPECGDAIPTPAAPVAP